MKDPRPDIKKRFLKVMRMIIADERWEDITSDAKFAEAIGIFPQQLYHVKKEKDRHVTIEMVYNTCERFDISANHIICGDLPIQKTTDSASEKLRKIEKILQN